MARTPDLDELSRLEEERDFLLQSIRDLDREHAAGDVDDDDYEELRRGYMARAAEAIAAVESEQGDLESLQASAKPAASRRLAWIGGCALFAIVAGVLLANGLGSRIEGGTVTGNSGQPGAAAQECRTLSRTEYDEAIDCYDKLLRDAPDNVEYLTYQGWAYARSGRYDEATERFDKVVELDPSYSEVWVFIASVRASNEDFVGAQAALDTLRSLNPPQAVLSTLARQGLERKIAIGLLPSDVAACWQQTEDGATALADATDDQGIDTGQADSYVGQLTGAAKCFEDLGVGESDNPDALTLRSFTLGLLASVVDRSSAVTLISTASQSATKVLELRPDDATALLLRATWRMWEGDNAAALADLDAVGDRPISVLVEPYVPREDLRAALNQAMGATSVAPTTTPTDAPG